MQILAAIVAAFGLLLAAFNWGTLVPRRDNRNVSPAPLAGGILLASGFLGFDATRPYWWLAILIDYGTFALLLASPMIIGEMWAHSDRNALHIFDSTIDDRTVTIRLFKNGDSVINISFDPPRPHGAYGDLAVSAGFVGKWRACGGHFEVNEYASGRKLRISRNAEKRYRLSENYPDGDDPSIYALDGIDVDATRLDTDG